MNLFKVWLKLLPICRFADVRKGKTKSRIIYLKTAKLFMNTALGLILAQINSPSKKHDDDFMQINNILAKSVFYHLKEQRF